MCNRVGVFAGRQDYITLPHLLVPDFGGLFSGVSIVRWMMETLDGISSEEEAESLGQLLVDKGALMHSEGSRCVDLCVHTACVRVLFSFLLLCLLLSCVCVLRMFEKVHS